MKQDTQTMREWRNSQSTGQDSGRTLTNYEIFALCCKHTLPQSILNKLTFSRDSIVPAHRVLDILANNGYSMVHWNGCSKREIERNAALYVRGLAQPKYQLRMRHAISEQGTEYRVCVVTLVKSTRPPQHLIEYSYQLAQHSLTQWRPNNG